MEDTEVTVTIRVPGSHRGQFRFAGVIFCDRGPGVRKCGETAERNARQSLPPIDVEGVAV